MSFQNARNNMEHDTLVTGRIEHIGQKEFNSKGTPLQKITINDGEDIMKATVYLGKGEPMPVTLVGSEQSFSLKAKDYKGNTYFGGFWNNPNPTPKQAPKQYDNAGKDYSKANKSYDKAEKSYDKASNEKTRSVCLSYAKDMVIGETLPIDEMYTEAQKMVDFVESKNGFVENEPAKESNPEDDLPF